jgi:hypothetical protein
VTNPAERLLADIERHGWTYLSNPELLALSREHPRLLPSLVEAALTRVPSASIGRGVVDYLPASALVPLVELAVGLYSSDEHRSASGEFLSHVALQFPSLLHPWLTQLFEQEVNFAEYHGVYAWRESGEAHLAYLLDVVRSGGDAKRAMRALNCMLETRTPAAFRAVERHEELLAGGSIYLRQSARIEYHLPGVGYACSSVHPARSRSGWARNAADFLSARFPRPGKERWRRLYPEASYHLAFVAGYLPEYLPGKLAHPTFHLDSADAAPAPFGGAGAAECGACGRGVYHLLTLDPVPAGLGVTSVPALVLETCFHCVWGGLELWWKHDSAGRPSAYRQGSGPPADWTERAPFQETMVRLVPTPARWYWQDARNEWQNLTRLGGYPSWIQDAEYYSCPDCEEAMSFL